MAEWKVSAEKIEIFPHPKADRLDVARVGLFQLVVNKAAGYRTGDIVVFAPKRSVLPEDIRGGYTDPTTGISYLSDGCRVSSRLMRGELSEGATLPADWVLGKLGLKDVSEIRLGEDLSGRLGITEYEYPIEPSLARELVRYGDTQLSLHDVEGFVIFGDELTPGEEVVASEKMHGMQVAVVGADDGQVHVTTKTLLHKGFVFRQDADNAFVRAVSNSAVADALASAYPSGTRVQLFGELIPSQRGGWTYGQDPLFPVVFFYRLEVEGVRLPPLAARAALPSLEWAPVLYHGPYDPAALKPFSKGRETVSGRALHIREGIVIEPVGPRLTRQKFPLYLKMVNPDFRDTDDTPS